MKNSAPSLPVFLCHQRQKGFTLIEIVATLVLLGIMAVFASLGITQISKGFIFAKNNAATAGNANLAMHRLIKEFTAITNVSSGTASAITFTSKHSSSSNPTYTISVSGTDLMMNDGTNNDILAVNVSSFALAYYDTYDGSAFTTWAASRKIISISLGLTGAENIITTFTSKVTPRNL